MHYNKIKNPITGRQVNVNSTLGRKILGKYLSNKNYNGGTEKKKPQLKNIVKELKLKSVDEVELFFNKLKNNHTNKDIISEIFKWVIKKTNSDIDMNEIIKMINSNEINLMNLQLNGGGAGSSKPQDNNEDNRQRREERRIARIQRRAVRRHQQERLDALNTELRPLRIIRIVIFIILAYWAWFHNETFLEAFAHK